MPTIYRKTALGVTEIETRSHKLPQRLRGLLIMVDGKRDTAALGSLAPQQAEQALAQLHEQGFIEPAGESLPAPAPAAAPAPRPGADFEARRRNIVRALHDTLGPGAESIAIKVERARTPEELQALQQQVLATVGAMRGRTVSEAFAARFLDRVS